MARIFSSGFELGVIAQSSDTFGEFDAAQTNGGPSSFDPGAISTTIKRSGTSSLRVNGSLSAGTNGRGVIQDTHNGTTNRKMWFRAYVRFESFPSVITSVSAIGDNNLATNVVSTVNASGQIQLYSFNNGTSGYDAIGALSFALNLSQWYRIEISVDTTTPTSWSGELRIDGTTISTMSGQNGGDSPCASIHVFAASLTGAAVSSIDQYYDDLAANDASGADNTSWPGAGSIFHMYPDSAGDSNQWATEAGAASSNNFQKVDEVSPDNATTYVKRTATGTLTDDYNLQTSASAGIGAADTVRLVQVGCRIGATSSTTTNRGAILRIKGQASGTVQSSGTLNWAIANAWANHQIFSSSGPVCGPYGLTATTNPQTGAAWITSALDTMQIGLQNAQSSANEIRCSSIWALVEVVPVTIQQGTAVFALDLEAIISTKQNALTFPVLTLSGSLIANVTQLNAASITLNLASILSLNALWFPIAQQTFPCSSNISVDTSVSRRAAAVLPGTSSFATDSIPKFTINVSMPLSSVLSAVGKQWWASAATLSPDSSAFVSLTRQNVGVFATFPIASDLSVSAVFQFKLSSVLSGASDLSAMAWQWWRDTASFALNSNLSAVGLQRWAASAIFNQSSFLQTTTIQMFAGLATLATTSTIVVTASGKFQPAEVELDLSSSLSVGAVYRLRITASLSLNSDLSAKADRYINASSVLKPTSTLDVPDTDRYISSFNVVLAGASSLLQSQIQFVYAIVAELDLKSSLVANTIQLFTRIGSAQFDCSSSLVLDARDYKVAGNIEFDFSSDFRVSFTPLLRPAFNIALSGDSVLSIDAAIKQRTISSAMFGTSSLTANAVFQFAGQSSYQFSSTLSFFTMQRWDSRPSVNLSSDLKATVTHKMLDTAKFALASQCYAGQTIRLVSGAAKLDGILSSLRVSTIIHEVENHAKTQKHLRGSINVRHLKAGMSEEVLDDGVIH